VGNEHIGDVHCVRVDHDPLDLADQAAARELHVRAAHVPREFLDSMGRHHLAGPDQDETA
jgi:hypothetical protein